MNKAKEYSFLHRFLHWTIALSMMVLLITGFLRMYWMSRKTITGAIEKAVGTDIVIEKTQLRSISKSIQKPMWEWHEYAAYIILVLFVMRIIYMLVKGLQFPNPFKSAQPAALRMRGTLYLVFYLFTAVSTVTGFYLKWGSGDWKQPMEMVHKWAIYWFPIFVVLHIAGIIIAELTDRKGVVSDMIAGK